MNGITMKQCSRCKEFLSLDNFRIRTDNRLEPPLVYHNNTCRKCDCEAARKYYQKYSVNPEFKKKNSERARKYGRMNKDLIKEKKKVKRQTQEYKENRKRYCEQNKAKIMAQEKIAKRRHHEKNVRLLTDNYVASHIVQRTNIPKSEILKQPELIDAFRQVKLINRKIKNESKP